MNFFQWLGKNKEWLFSGIGVVALGGIYAILSSFDLLALDSETLLIIALLIVSVIVLLVWRRHKRPAHVETHQILHPGPTATTGTEHHDPTGQEVTKREPAATTIRISALNYQDIRKAIKSVPPFQQKATASNYQGIWVQWDCELWDATKSDKGLVRVMLHISGTISHSVVCTVRYSDYPELAILREGAPLIVKGRIQEIDDLSVRLVDAELQLHQTGPQSSESNSVP